jgi:hypothetical protein
MYGLTKKIGQKDRSPEIDAMKLVLHCSRCPPTDTFMLRYFTSVFVLTIQLASVVALAPAYPLQRVSNDSLVDNRGGLVRRVGSPSSLCAYFHVITSHDQSHSRLSRPAYQFY